MAALSDMPKHEVDATEDNPRLLKAQQMTGSIRWLELYRSYLLAEELDEAPRGDHKEIIDHWARNMGMTPGTLKGHLGWARAIDLQLLTDTFEGEGISEQEWTQRIGTSHLQVIARARDQATDTRISPGEMVTLVVECYHGNWSVAELKAALRNRDLMAPERGLDTTPSKTPNTLCRVLRRIADVMEQTGQDIDMTRQLVGREHKEMPVPKALRRLGELVEQLYPRAAFRLVEEAETK